MLIGRDGELMAVKGLNGLVARESAEDNYEIEQWLRLGGWDEITEWGRAATGLLACDSLGCLYRPRKDRVVALMHHPGAAVEDCQVAEVVVYRYRLWQDCSAPPFGPKVIDSRPLRSGGGHALYLESWGWRIETVAERRGDRPWSRVAP